MNVLERDRVKESVASIRSWLRKQKKSNQPKYWSQIRTVLRNYLPDLPFTKKVQSMSFLEIIGAPKCPTCGRRYAEKMKGVHPADCQRAAANGPIVSMPFPFSSSRIAPRLHQGSAPPPGRYDVALITLAAMEYAPSRRAFPESIVHYAPLDDNYAGMRAEEPLIIERAAALAADVWRKKGRVLITCMQGRNRSGVIMARTLMHLRVPVEIAIQLVQKQRPNALQNPHFLSYLRAL